MSIQSILIEGREMVLKDDMPQVMVNYLQDINQYHARKTTISSVNEVLQSGVVTDIGIFEAWLYENYEYSQHESDRLFLSKIFGKYKEFCAEHSMNSMDRANFSKHILYVVFPWIQLTKEQRKPDKKSDVLYYYVKSKTDEADQPTEIIEVIFYYLKKYKHNEHQL